MSDRLRAYIDLAVALSWRELVVRYKRSVLGVIWALIDPAFQVLVYLAIFGVVLDAGRGLDDSYPFFMAMGVLPWLFFSMSVDSGTTTLMEHYLLIRKLSFPHELLVVSILFSRLTSLAVGVLVVLVGAGIGDVAGFVSPQWSALPFALLGTVLMIAFTAGITLVTSALQVVFGDVAFIVRFGLRILFYACPIVYPITRVPEAARGFYELNPMVSIVWCFQTFVGPSVPSPSDVGWAAGVIGSFVSLVVGWVVFKRLRGVVAELV